MPIIDTDKLISAQLHSNKIDKVIVAKNISLANFAKLPVRIRLVNGKIEAYEVPSRPHGEVAFRVAQFVSAWKGA